MLPMILLLPLWHHRMMLKASVPVYGEKKTGWVEFTFTETLPKALVSWICKKPGIADH